MSKRTDLLTKERQTSSTLNTLLLSTFITGVVIWLVRSHTVWTQWNSLVHIMLGCLVFVCLIPYLYNHFRRTFGIRRGIMLYSGLMATLILLFCIGSGLVMTLSGQQESRLWIRQWHLVGAILVCTLLVFHIVYHFWSLPIHSKDSYSSKLSGTPRASWKVVLLGNLLIQIGIATASIIYAPALTPQPQLSLVAEYELPYGPSPFSPSLTEVSHGGFVESDEIADSAKCFNCHADIGEQWLSSMHKQAASDPTYVTNITLLVKNKGIAAARYCEGCHAPIALLTGALSQGGTHGGIEGAVANHEGISCMSCHGIHSLPSIKGVASYEFTPAKKYLFSDSSNEFLQSMGRLLVKTGPTQHKQDMGADILHSSRVCASCHTQFMDKDINDWGWFRMQDEYAAWFASPFSQQEQDNFSSNDSMRCQDCHMPLVKAIDPSANKDGLVRSHRFLGANTFVPTLTGDSKQLEATKAFLQKNKIRLHIDPPTRSDSIQNNSFVTEKFRGNDEAPYFYYLNELASVQLVVNNTGVGHNFPGGTIDLNEVWIEFTVNDALGNEVFSSGGIDSGNNVDENAYFYRSIPIDRKGQHVWKHDLFNMIGHSFKRVIRSGESDIVKFEFTVPASVKSPLTISARLRYRKLNNQYARWALKDKYFELPITDIAWDSLQVPVKIRKNTQ